MAAVDHFDEVVVDVLDHVNLQQSASKPGLDYPSRERTGSLSGGGANACARGSTFRRCVRRQATRAGAGRAHLLLAQELLHEVGRELLLQSHSNCAQRWVACGRQL